MNRATKITKLANAIRAYRGAYDTVSKIWHISPKPAERPRVVAALQRLGVDVETGMAAIDGFKTFEQMRDWFKALEVN